MEGCSCDFTGCRTRDFLPFVCDLCKQRFCIDHRSRFTHNCISEPHAATPMQPSSSARASEMFQNVENRFTDAPQGSQRTHFGLKTSAVPTDTKSAVASARISKLDSIAKSAHTTKDKNIANKTKHILFKNKATGNSNIAYEERFYLEVLFDITQESRYLFFSYYATLGEVIRDIGKVHTTLAYGQPTIPEGCTLALCSEERPHWQAWDRSAVLSTCLAPFSTVRVISVSMECALEAQNQLAEASGHASNQISPSGGDPPTPQEPFRKGDRILHTASNGVQSRGVVVAVHRDDTELYYTVRLQYEGGERERQTDAGHLQADSVEGTEEKGVEVKSEEHTCTSNMGETFSVSVSYKGKCHLVSGVGVAGTVESLKAAIAGQLGVARAKQKLIFRGKVLRDDSLPLRGSGLYIPDKGVVMMMLNR